MKPHKGTSFLLPAEEPQLQYAALPWREGDDCAEVLLVSTRGTQRWIIPKGWPMKGLSARDAAAREALEEAGVEGKIGKRTLGAFHYRKRAPSGESLYCRVTVFPLAVTHQRKSWPESKERITRWFAFKEAALAVREPELSQLISAFGDWLEQRAARLAHKKARASAESPA